MTLTNIILKRATALLTRKSIRMGYHGRNKISYSNSLSIGLNSIQGIKVSSWQSRVPVPGCRKMQIPVQIARPFATGFQFRHDENLNAARLLYSIPQYKNLVFQHKENGTDVEEVLEAHFIQQGQGSSSSRSLVTGRVQMSDTWRKSVLDFIEASYSSLEQQLPVTHPKNEEIVGAVLKELNSLTEEELSQTLYHLRFFGPFPHVKDPAYMKIWNAFDQECRDRSQKWSLDFCFVIADLWYGLGLARLSNFHWAFVTRLFRRCDKLSKEHYVRFMFCLNLQRSIPENFSSYDLEYRLSKLVDEMTAEEIVIIAMAFFKTQVHIRDQVVLQKLLSISMKKSDTLDSISVSAIAKLARYCAYNYSAQVIYDFQEKFIPEISRLSVAACTHLALAATSTLTPHMGLMEKVVEYIKENIANTRLKELERIALAVTMFNMDCESLLQVVAEELQRPERADEIRKYGRCLPAILHYLSIKNIFIPDLISTVLSKTFRATYYGRGKEILQRELLCLDVAAELELPDYDGNRLEPKIFNAIMKKNMTWLKAPSKVKVPNYERFVRSVSESMEEIVKDKECFYICNILPQHGTTTILYCRDKEGQFAKIPQYFVDLPQYVIKKIQNDQEDLTYYALMLCSRNLCLYNKRVLNGQACLQIRQTKKLGYKTNLVYYIDWEEIRDPLKFTKHIEEILSSDGQT